ncbi:MAG: glycosyltransferase [Dehalococcoidia bacterium]|nr:glycosyltransferase [Dehalococcoidia bacterium]
MYGTLALPQRALDDLAEAAGDRAIEELRALARPLEGLRVLNLSVTGFGTGTAELLNSAVPLLSDLGLDCHWQVVRGSEDTAHVTRAMYQALGGVYVPWTHDMTEKWERYASMNAELLTEQFDVIVVHDPQPAAIRSFVPQAEAARWLFHSHLDLSSAQEDVWLLLRPHVEKYDAVVFEAESFARQDLSVPMRIIPPAIDPSSPRDMPLPDEVINTVTERYGIDHARPVLCQASPCEPASKLTEAIDVWERVRERHPGLQLVIVLMTDPQDPPARACYEELARRTNDEPDVFVLSMGNELGNVELNVFQRVADVNMQRGLRKGFGMWISDALWKRRACVVAPNGGLTEQVIDGETGLVAESTDEFAAAISRLLDAPETAARFGARGRERVARQFLITRYLRDSLEILTTLHRE